MRLTAYTDFALRLLMYLAVKDDRLATIAEIAGSYAISKNHLTKIVHALGVAGYVDTVRGRSGGIRLGRPAGAIRIGDIVRLTETDMDVVPCLDPQHTECPLRRACALRGAMERARRAFIGVLDEYTLHDLTAAPEPMRALLGLAAPAAPFAAVSR